MRLIITRHGETLENQKRIIQGHLPGHLSKLGIDQAKKLAKRLKEEKINYIYSSDLARAADTVREIAKFHPGASLVLTRELRERNLGEFQGKSAEEIDWDKEKDKYHNPERGESDQKMHDRAKKFLFEVLEKHKKDTVLFVGHDGIDRALIAIITGEKIERLDNTSVNIFEIDGSDHKIHVLNCTKHLD